MKIYTKTGDQGETGLLGGARVSKDHDRIEAYGVVDELNAALGVALTEAPGDDLERLVSRLQHELFVAGAELARPTSAGRATDAVDDRMVRYLEAEIDRLEDDLEPLKQFILPGGTPAAAHLHLARTICRRAERRIVTLARTPGNDVSEQLLRYFNRLGDLLFVMARAANRRQGHEDVPWRK